MDLFRMECFLKAAELGSLTRAAERMRITQPAMSFQIRELEKEVQLTLFERAHGGVVLTEAGRVMRDGFMRILDSYYQLLDNARACTCGKRRLTIGFHGPIDWAGTNRFVAAFSERHPEIDVAVLQQQWRELADYLEFGALDLAFLETSELKNRRALAAVPLFRENTSFAVAASHRLAGRGSVRIEDLAGETILMNNHPSDCMTEIIDHLYRSGLAPEAFRFFDQPDTTLAMAAAAQGLASIPCSFERENSALRYVEYDAPACRMDYSLAWNPATDNRAAQLFVAEAQAAVWPYTGE